MRTGWRILAAGAAVWAGGCGKPSTVNIDLRKDIQKLEATTRASAEQLAAAEARIQGLEAQRPTVPVLPEAQLAKLFTVQKVTVDRLSHGVKLKPDAAADDAVRVYVSPRDADDDTIKATGQYTIEVFDLSGAQPRILAKSEFTPEQAKEHWVGLLTRAFVFDCPLSAKPEHGELTVKVTFRDELTQRVVSDQRVIKVNTGAGAATQGQ